MDCYAKMGYLCQGCNEVVIRYRGRNCIDSGHEGYDCSPFSIIRPHFVV